MKIKTGNHLGTVRRWIQNNFINGETVKWSSNEILNSRYDMTPYRLEYLAQRIRDAVLSEFKIKDKDYDYRYLVFCSEGCPAFQHADNKSEIWSSLFKSTGNVVISQKDVDNNYTVVVFSGTTQEALDWCRGVK